jgi:thioredoxin reductase
LFFSFIIMQHDDKTSSKSFDLVIIGAGIYGIQVARTYLELHPTKHIIVVEASESTGGVWSRERVYNDFWTQTPVGILEFSDQPIHDIPEQDQYHGFFKASHVTRYLEEYCSSHVYDGVSLASRMIFGTLVTKVYKTDEIWCVETSVKAKPGPQYRAPQIVDASGLTSVPNWPDFPRCKQFHGRILHHKDFAEWERDQENHRKTRIAVLGGAKSAADVAYSSAKAGHQVTWIIRRSGSGPAAFVSAKGSFGYANSNEAFYTRFTSLFLGSLFSFDTGYNRVLGWIHSTAPGRTLLRRIWQCINTKAWKEAAYDRPDGQKNGFQNLKPDSELFWQNDSTGINQREDFFDVIAKEVSVVRKDVSHMCNTGLVMEDHTVVEADIVICATGWKIDHPYFEPETAAILGLPVATESADAEIEAHSADLQALAEKDVVDKLPILDSKWALAQASRDCTRERGLTPLCLWKSMVPLNDPSIIFVGKLMLGNHFRNSEVQALFASAVLDGALVLPPVVERERDVAEHVAWCRRRYPGGKGKRGNWVSLRCSIHT